jgi:hypothetical protein
MSSTSRLLFAAQRFAGGELEWKPWVRAVETALEERDWSFTLSTDRSTHLMRIAEICEENDFTRSQTILRLERCSDAYCEVAGMLKRAVSDDIAIAISSRVSMDATTSLASNKAALEALLIQYPARATAAEEAARRLVLSESARASYCMHHALHPPASISPGDIMRYLTLCYAKTSTSMADMHALEKSWQDLTCSGLQNPIEFANAVVELTTKFNILGLTSKAKNDEDIVNKIMCGLPMNNGGTLYAEVTAGLETLRQVLAAQGNVLTSAHVIDRLKTEVQRCQRFGVTFASHSQSSVCVSRTVAPLQQIMAASTAPKKGSSKDDPIALAVKAEFDRRFKASKDKEEKFNGRKSYEATKGRSNASSASSSSKKNDDWKKSVDCHHCGKHGHIARECRSNPEVNSTTMKPTTATKSDKAHDLQRYFHLTPQDWPALIP